MLIVRGREEALMKRLMDGEGDKGANLEQRAAALTKIAASLEERGSKPTPANVLEETEVLLEKRASYEGISRIFAAVTGRETIDGTYLANALKYGAAIAGTMENLHSDFAEQRDQSNGFVRHYEQMLDGTPATAISNEYRKLRDHSKSWVDTVFYLPQDARTDFESQIDGPPDAPVVHAEDKVVELLSSRGLRFGNPLALRLINETEEIYKMTENDSIHDALSDAVEDYVNSIRDSTTEEYGLHNIAKCLSTAARDVHELIVYTRPVASAIGNRSLALLKELPAAAEDVEVQVINYLRQVQMDLQRSNFEPAGLEENLYSRAGELARHAAVADLEKIDTNYLQLLAVVAEQQQVLARLDSGYKEIDLSKFGSSDYRAAWQNVQSTYSMIAAQTNLETKRLLEQLRPEFGVLMTGDAE